MKFFIESFKIWGLGSDPRPRQLLAAVVKDPILAISALVFQVFLSLTDNICQYVTKIVTPSRAGVCPTARGQEMLGADREIWNMETNGPSMSSRPQLKTLCNGLALFLRKQEAFGELISSEWLDKRIAYYPIAPSTRIRSSDRL